MSKSRGASQSQVAATPLHVHGGRRHRQQRRDDGAAHAGPRGQPQRRGAPALTQKVYRTAVEPAIAATLQLHEKRSHLRHRHRGAGHWA